MTNHPKFTESHDSAARSVGYEGARGIRYILGRLWLRSHGFAARRYECPICEYGYLIDDPSDQTFEICPQCGTEFGAYDWCHGWTELRKMWRETEWQDLVPPHRRERLDKMLDWAQVRVSFAQKWITKEPESCNTFTVSAVNTTSTSTLTLGDFPSEHESGAAPTGVE